MATAKSQSSPSPFLDVLRKMAEMEECLRAENGPSFQDWNTYLQDLSAVFEEMLPNARRAKAQAEERANQTQAG